MYALCVSTRRDPAGPLQKTGTSSADSMRIWSLEDADFEPQLDHFSISAEVY